jgi:hypothetical protein
MREKGFTAQKLKRSQEGMGVFYGVSLVLALISAYVLAHVMGLSENFFGYPILQTGLISAFWIWLGFVMPVQATATIFSEKKNWKLFGIDTGYQLVSLLAMGAVIALL